VTTVRATTKAARAMGAGAMRTTTMTAATVATAATMTPNGNKDNEDGNSKNSDKAMSKPTMTTEEGEPRQ